MNKYDYTVPLKAYVNNLGAAERKVLAEILEEVAKSEREEGAAGITVKLSDSRIKVESLETGGLIMAGKVEKGAWDRIFDAISNEFV